MEEVNKDVSEDLNIFKDFLKNLKNIKLKGLTDEKAISDVEADFTHANWIVKSALTAEKMKVTTHPPKFSHPYIKNTTNILAERNRSNDGLLKTGNVDVDLDATGHPSIFSVSRFLSLKMSDGKTILDNIKEDTDIAKLILKDSENLKYNDLKKSFLTFMNEDKEHVSSDLISQVYFPCDNGYHLLSILHPSGIIFRLKERINDIKFNNEVYKASRESKKNNEYNDSDFYEIYDLTVLLRGGAHPKNISLLNNNNQGLSNLLLSMPPILEDKNIIPPKKNFFVETLKVNEFKNSLEFLHSVLIKNRNNYSLRNERDKVLLEIFDLVSIKVYQLRELDEGWSNNEIYNNLPKSQKILLDNINKEYRDDYKGVFIEELTRWMLHTYKKIMKDKALNFSDYELIYIKNLFIKSEDILS